MAITIVAVGKLKEQYLRDAAAEYQKRLTVAKLKIVELAEEKLPALPSEAEITAARDKEGERILAALPKDCYHIALDSKGVNPDSLAFAALLADLALQGRPDIAFSIGGSDGLADKVKSSADYLLSFGAMTYPHQLMRVILLEQLYRAFKIIRGEPYHK